jgi:hypothetical protein
LSIKRRLDRLVEAQQARRLAALDRLLELLTPEEAEALVATLEADLAGRPITPDIEQQMDVAFARVWTAMTPEELVPLLSSI